jgi:hypothetical protein
MIGDQAQYNELLEVYSRYDDDELLALARKPGDLTPLAQEVLNTELARRHLSVTPAPAAPKRRIVTDDEEDSPLRVFAALAPPECVFEFPDNRTVANARLALTAVGIESVSVYPQQGSSDMRAPRVVVAPDDAEHAASVLAQLTTEHLSADSDDSPIDEFQAFEEPRCPACGADESVLESVDPVNEWHCEACGKNWLEEEPAS